MKKLFLFAAIAGLGLVSASPPAPKGGPDKPEGAAAYPPCSRTVTDSCNQLHERRARSRRHYAGHRRHHARRHAAHARAGYAPAAHARAAYAPAAHPRAAYAPAPRAAPAARPAAATPQERARVERIRRAGESG